jgi:uncharacterized membrane protein YkoI
MIRIAFALTALVLLSSPSLSRSLDHNGAREALLRGDIRSLAIVLAVATKIETGNVIELKLERKQGRKIYEIDILTSEGRKVELYFDASSLQLIKKKP